MLKKIFSTIFAIIALSGINNVVYADESTEIIENPDPAAKILCDLSVIMHTFNEKYPISYTCDKVYPK